jgi:hypothetical protein
MKKWEDLIYAHGNVEGARAAWEDACALAISYLRPNEDVRLIRTHQGDFGIDVLVGSFVSPVDVYQCKFFVDGVGATQRSQITASYSRAAHNDKYVLKDWYLCLPVAMSVDESKHFDKWKADEESLTGRKITNVSPVKLMELAYKHKFLSAAFNDELGTSLRDLLDAVVRGQRPSPGANDGAERSAGKVLCELALKIGHGMEAMPPLLRGYYLKSQGSDADAGDAAAEFLRSLLYQQGPEFSEPRRMTFIVGKPPLPSLAVAFMRKYDAVVKAKGPLDGPKPHPLSGESMFELYRALLGPEFVQIRKTERWPSFS